jgi:hypothetical protein
MYKDSPFTQDNLRAIYDVISGDTIMHMDQGGGVIVRHDIDDCPEKAYRGSLIEDEYGIKSAYYILNTAGYWGEGLDCFADMQERGHEIGWHNDVVSQYFRGAKNVKKEITEPLERLRGMGLEIKGTATHGSPEALLNGMVNHYVWKESKPVLGYPGEFPKRYSLNKFGLEYESHFVEHDYYYTDSMAVFFGGWEEGCIIDRLKNAIKKGRRVILLIHHQTWDI